MRLRPLLEWVAEHNFDTVLQVTTDIYTLADQ
jgi:hypothetical protein